MAHFVELDENNIVIQSIVVNNDVILDESGNESEALGIVFCKNLLGGRWIQTSYNSKIRYNYAGIGYTYDPIDNAFIAPMPECGHDTLLLNAQKRWECESCAAETLQSRTTA
jgi:hypothetical protein